jgi:tetratricopeptide (TPR) repeat protein
MLVSATSIVPVCIMGIRWPSSFGDTSAAGFKLTNAMFYVLHAIFLLACTYVAFDPVFSPRNLAINHGVGSPFLSVYYLGALSVGYFSGYFLLVFGQESGRPWDRPTFLRRVANLLITGALWLLLVGVPAGLAYKNLPLIRANATPAVSNYGRHLAESLPAEGCIVMSDDANRLYALASALDQTGRRNNYILLDTVSLPFATYHKFLREHYRDRWPKTRMDESIGEMIDSASLSELVFGLSQTNVVCYLHPSFGYYFEFVYAKPHGLVFRLQPNAPKVVETPSFTSGEIEQTEAAWGKLRDELDSLARSVKQARTNKNAYANDVWAGMWYSRALNYWGVELQKRNELTKAAARFAQALALNPENPVALVNADFNRHLQSGQPAQVFKSERFQKQLEQYRGNGQTLLTLNGPFDEPAFCFELGTVFHRGNLFRQAALQFQRVQQLDPNDFNATISLASVYVQGRAPGLALELINNQRSQKNPHLLNSTNAMLMASVEGAAYLAINNIETAVKTFEQAEQTYPQNPDLFSLIARVYATYGKFSNALAATEKQLKLVPDSPEALLNKGAYCIELKDFDQAIPPLNRLLELQPEYPSALFNRAIAYFRTDKLDAAQKDFEKVELLVPPNHAIYYGLGEIAYRKNQKRTAFKYYTLYLKYAPRGTAEYKAVTDRHKELKGAR